MKETILITGAAGFIGSHLTRFLLEAGNRVIGVDNESTGSKQNLESILGNPLFEYITADAQDERILSRLTESADTVYHLAAAVGVALVAHDPIQTIETNINLTQTLLRVLQKRNQTRSVSLYFASTSEVYGRNPARIWREDDELVYGPTTIGRWSYGLSKAIDEHLVLSYSRQFGLKAVIGRFFNVVGARQTGRYGMVLPRFVAQAKENKPLTIYDDGAQQRCFIHVKDVVEIITRLMNKTETNGQIYNIGSNESVTIKQLAQKVIDQTGSKSVIQYVPSTDVYGLDFEDCRWRTPDISKLLSTLDYRAKYTLTDAIADLSGNC